MSESTARHGLPLIAPGQAQKELSHNEALAALDILAHPYAESVGANTPPGSPAEGQCWIVGGSPTAAWSGHAHALAGWTAGGWRFVEAREGMIVRTAADTGFASYTGGAWQVGIIAGAALKLSGDQVVGPRRPAIADASGGATVDGEARAAVNAVLAALRGHGLIAP